MKITVIIAAGLLCGMSFTSQESTASPRQTGKSYNSDTTMHHRKRSHVKSKGKSAPENRNRDTGHRNMNPGSTNMHNTMDEKRGNTSDSTRR